MSNQPSWLAEALAGHPVVTRSGKKAYIRHYEDGLDFPYWGITDSELITWRQSPDNPEELHHLRRTGDYEWDIVGLWKPEPLTFEYWHVIHPELKYLCMNSLGAWCFYGSEPHPEAGIWREGNLTTSAHPLSGDAMPTVPENYSWQDTLIKRPEGV